MGFGPKETFSGYQLCCGAALRIGHSLHTENLNVVEFKDRGTSAPFSKVKMCVLKVGF